jgi:hypothetical protein
MTSPPITGSSSTVAGNAALRRRHTPDSLQRQTPKYVAKLEHGLEHNDNICLSFFFFRRHTSSSSTTYVELLDDATPCTPRLAHTITH